MNGEIHGSVKIEDVNATWYEPLTRWFNYLIATDPTNHAQLEMIFDLGDYNGGNCKNPDGTAGVPKDMIISICELTGNQLIANLISPDVAIFDAAGNYSPDPDPKSTRRDSLSVGLGFTAVPATW